MNQMLILIHYCFYTWQFDRHQSYIFRENNSFCQECPPIVVETTFDKVKGGEKFKKKEKKDKKKKYKKPMKKQTTARTTTTIRPVFSTTTTPIELGPFGKILRDLIQANTFIDK